MKQLEANALAEDDRNLARSRPQMISKEDPAMSEIFSAIKAGDIDELKRLAAAGADFTGADKYSWTAPHWAALSGNPEIVRVVREAGADSHRVARLGTPEMVHAVCEAGADFTVADNHSVKPAHWAVNSKNPEVVRAVHEAGADFTIVNKYGRTPLGVAVKSNNPKIVRAVQEAARADQVRNAARLAQTQDSEAKGQTAARSPAADIERREA